MRYLAGLLVLILCSCGVRMPPNTALQASSQELPDRYLRTTEGAPYHRVPEQFPIRLTINPSLSTNYRIAVEEAVRYWNESVGFEFLVFDEHVFVQFYTTENERETIHITQRELGINPSTNTRKMGEAESFVVRETGEIWASIIRLDTDMTSPRDVRTVVVHELGHALGIRHNEEDESSIMYPLVTVAPQYLTRQDIMHVQAQLPDRLPKAEYLFPATIRIPAPNFCELNPLLFY